MDEVSPISKLNVRDQIAYYTRLADFTISPECKLFREELQHNIESNELQAAKSLFKKDLTRAEMIEKLDEVIELKGINNCLYAVIQKLDPDAIKAHLELLENDLAEELEEKEQEEDDI